MERRTVIKAALAYVLAPVTAWAQGSPGTPDLSRYGVGPLPPEFFTAWRTGEGAIGEWRGPADRRRQLLRRPRQCARGQRQLLPRGQGQAAAGQGCLREGVLR